MLRSVGWITGGILIGLAGGALLGAVAVEAYGSFVDPGRSATGEFAGIGLLVGGICGAVVGTIAGAVLGAIADTRLQRGGRE
jgi:hypothetical protein